MQPCDVTIVSVCYNSAGVLAGMLDSLPAQTPVILVDNASNDSEALEELAHEYGAKILYNKQNTGFGRACNQGAAQAQTPFLLFLNPDARLHDGALHSLLKAAEKYSSAVGFNPRLQGPAGKAQFKRRSKLLPRSQWMARGWPDADCTVPVLSGAALFVRAEDFRAVGGFDPGIFLYHEDDDLSLRLKTRRGRLMFVHDAVVEHFEGSSSARTPQSAAFKAYHLARSAIYTKRKHKRPVPLLSTLAEALQKLASPPMLLSARKRAQALGFLKGALSMIKG